MEITATLVKKLRDETDAPLMDCKRALQDAAADQGGDANEEAVLNRAREILRESGKTQAAKRSDREVKNGVIAVAKKPGVVSLVSLLSETDFVARNEEFIAEAQALADAFLEQDPGDDPLSAIVGGVPVRERIEALVAKIRENIQLGAAKRIESDKTIGVYLHHDKAKAGVVVAEGGDEDLASKVAMQVVAFPSVEVISESQIDQERLQREIEMEKKRAMDEGQPEERAQKIAEGRVNKEFLSAAVLLNMPWFLDNKKKVSEIIGDMKILRIVRMQAGGTPLDCSL